ncbi:tetratricopeptide repeat protein [Nocardiopsis sp. L17-MgMaSL7]|uniref:tetratricopeptide repeat protein n=1 Tax=Nocardiopsis sp. L17-MgMaSL7 TaxID=1938893 RepID=UPI000D717152|nr:tetratricopeptide repeat protein [Nocardiopsis sp. L17-MgMaSL7]PWV50041.1 tetratricopeptide repeat protein [Nocardiopsis sp. L17-MgMaSL7]
MAPPPEARNRADGPVYGHLVQARDIHGGVTVNAAPAAAPVPDVSLDPPRPATAVRGRHDLLTTLREGMHGGDAVPHVLTGPGGFGKTTVAAALAEHARTEGWTVFWVRPDTILPSMLEVAVELGGTREEADRFRTAPRQAARWVWRHLDASPRPWLLVIDNADQPELLDPENRPGEQRGWMRSSPGGFVLVTSRVDDPALWAPATVHRVGSLQGRDAVNALVDHAGERELPGAEELAARLGGVPLALFLAGRILATHGVLFPDPNSLLAHLDEDLARLDELSAPLVTGEDGERRLLSGVWELSLRMVGERDPHAEAVLRALALLGPRGRTVPLRRLPLSGLLGHVLAPSEEPLDEAAFARTVNALVVHGLVEVDQRHEEVGLRLHPLVSETVRARLGADDTRLVVGVAELLAGQVDEDPWFELGAFAALNALASRVSVLGPAFLAETGLAEATAHIQLGQFAEAEGVAGAARRTAEEALGPDHPLTLQARHLIAEGLLFQEHVSEAEREYSALLEDRRRALGAEHPRTLDTRHQIALVAGMRDDWASAREQHEEILRTRLRIQGPEAVETLASMDALGYAAMHEGDLSAAEELFREVERTRERLLGREHRLTMNATYKLGLLALRRGRPSVARTHFLSVLETRRRVLGEDHPQTQLVRERLDGVPRPEPRNAGNSASG